MKHLFTSEGDAAIQAVMQQRPLLAFDFDGTLAPIVSRPADARVSRAVASRLARLARSLPVAIVTGRAIEDVRPRLGFEPRFLVGNHGAEGLLSVDEAATLSGALDPLRRDLQAQAEAIRGAGVHVEDKGLSLALHYRLAPDRARAQALLESLLARHPGLHRFDGKMVINVTAAGAPDKADAVALLAERSGAAAALFAGDDVNDEPVFAAAPPHWLTVRIGREDPHTRARFVLDSPAEVAMLLERLLPLADAGPPRSS